MSGRTSACVVGVGFRGEAPAASIVAVVRAAIMAAGERGRMIAVPADKAQAPALREAALELGLAVEPISPEALRQADLRAATRSVVVAGYRGVGCVCEAAALAGAGPGARLLVSRIVSRDGMATVAAATQDAATQGAASYDAALNGKNTA